MASGPVSLTVMAPPEYSSTLSVKSRAQLPPGGMSGMKLTIDSSMGSTVAAAVVVVSGAACGLGGRGGGGGLRRRGGP